MQFSRFRVLAIAAAALAGLIVAGGAAAPASADYPSAGDHSVITIRGHVTEPDGKPIKGILAFAACPCATYAGAHQGDQDHTSSTGYYSLRVQKRFASTLYFSDHQRRYFAKAGKLKASGSGYIANATLERTSTVAGTVTAVDGAVAYSTRITFYDATTLKSRGSTSVRSDGTFAAHVHSGSYKVRFGGGRDLYTNEVWYGGVATAAESPAVTVGYGGAVTGIDATVTPKPTINGSLTIDGKEPLDTVRERVAVTVTDAGGARVGKTVTRSIFSFTGLTPGVFTISVAPTDRNHFVQPLTQTVTLAPGTAIRGLVLNLTSNPATAKSTRSTGIEFDETSKGIAKSGKVLKGKLVVSSYGSVKGGTLTIYVNGKKVATRTVPASGRLNWRYRPASVVIGTFEVKARFSGTSTARSRSTDVYALSGD